jgi:hypothetical protein
MGGGGNVGLPAAGPASMGMFGGMGPPPMGDAPGTGAGAPVRGGAPIARPAGGPGRGVNTALIDYLNANRGDAELLVATQSSMHAAPIIIATGEPVMALSGLSGGDAILTADQLAQYVQSGRVRFFLLPSSGFAGGAAPRAVTDAPPPEGMPGPLLGQGGAGPADPFPPAGNPQAPRPGSAQGMRPPAGSPVVAGVPAGRQTAIRQWVTAHCSPVPADVWQGTAAQSPTSPTSAGGLSFGWGQQLYDCATAAP